MTSLLSSIFGDTADKKKIVDKTADLFANPVTPPPPPLQSTKKRSQTAASTEKKEPSSVKKAKRDKRHDNVEQEQSIETNNVDNETEVAEETAANNNNVEHTTDNADDRTVFVGNLPFSTTRKDLARLFKPCGKIRSTRIRSVATIVDEAVKLPPHKAGNQKLVQQILVNQRKVNPDAKATVQGYVVFDDTESVEKALAFNNRPIPAAGAVDKQQGGESDETAAAAAATRRMRVDRVNKEYDARRSVFCGNMPYQADEESLRACFVQACQWKDEDIQGVRIVRDKETYKCKGFGYLLMADTSMVATALRIMDGVEYMGRPLRVRVCGKRFKTRSAENNDGSNSHNNSNSYNNSKAATKPKDTKPVAASLRQMVTKEQQQQQKQNKRKRGNKTTTVHSTGKSKRAASEAKTQQRIKKIEKRIKKGMGKTRNNA